MSKQALTLRLAGLPTGHSVHEGELEFVTLDAAETEEPCSVQVRTEVDNLGKRSHMRARVSGVARSSCHRCLTAFTRVVDTGFDLILQKGLEDPGDDDVVVVPEHAVEFDLTPWVREAVILEEPIRLLCSPGCRGLCAQCGADLNQGACGCTPAAEERWAPLRNLAPPEI